MWFDVLLKVVFCAFKSDLKSFLVIQDVMSFNNV